MWGVANVAWGLLFALMYLDASEGVSNALSGLWMVVMGAAILVPFFAVVFDGRSRVAVTLVASLWAGLILGLILAAQTAQWQRDDGLGTGFALVFAQGIAFVYPLCIALLMGVRRVVTRYRDGRSETRKTRFQ